MYPAWWSTIGKRSFSLSLSLELYLSTVLQIKDLRPCCLNTKQTEVWIYSMSDWLSLWKLLLPATSSAGDTASRVNPGFGVKMFNG